MSRLGDLGGSLYRGEVSYDIVRKRKRWYTVSGVFVAIAMISLLTRGLNLGIEFKGGAELQVPSQSCEVAEARAAVEEAGVTGVVVTKLGSDRVRIQTPALSTDEANKVKESLAKACDVAADDIDLQLVGPSWGGEITKKALFALLAFLVLVSIFLAIYFDWRMAVAALVALFHDIVLTIGIYSLTGFEVTPSTVIGVLTILGFSLYDTVVVFDKVKENTRGILGQSKQTYSEAANLALNQTLVRSINTSVVALLPVAAILVVGWGVLGAGTLKDLALALFVGMAAGTYSSIFIATPVLCQLEERDPQMQALAKRVESRGKAVEKAAEKAAAAAVEAGGDAEAAAAAAARVTAGVTGPRNQPRKQPKSKRK